jgi:rSAM/selenodomain-associated transferase 2
MRLAIVIPTLDEAGGIAAALAALAPLRRRGAAVIVVDGGSRDDTCRHAAGLADLVLAAPRGRALQMNAGARAPQAQAQQADVLLFLHADTRLPPDADRLIFRALSNHPRRWGHFDVRIDGRSRWLPTVARMMNLRARLTGIATGDQAIFVERGLFLALDGFAPIPLMEDIEFCARARHVTPPLALRACVVTAGRRWDTQGAWRTILRMWWLRAAYALGADPARLARRYRDAR